METSQHFILFLQSCITPVAFISGVGLLLLTITNRLGRTIDRTRHLVTELDNENVKRKAEKENEIVILYQRSKFLRNSILFIVISVICSSSIIPVLFAMNMWLIDLRILGYSLFVISIISILLSSIYFFRDITLSLHAIHLEAKEYLNQKHD